MRAVLYGCGLEETVKWGAPCYTHNGKNVVGLKDLVSIWFYQGVLLKDESHVLVNAQAGVTQAQRQWRLTSLKDIKPRLIKQYVEEAKQLIVEGKGVKARRSKPLVVPIELKHALAANGEVSAQFDRLNLTRQREFAEYIAGAKRDATKQIRLEKILPMIAAGIGLNNKYR